MSPMISPLLLRRRWCSGSCCTTLFVTCCADAPACGFAGGLTIVAVAGAPRIAPGLTRKTLRRPVGAATTVAVTAGGICSGRAAGNLAGVFGVARAGALLAGPDGSGGAGRVAGGSAGASPLVARTGAPARPPTRVARVVGRALPRPHSAPAGSRYWPVRARPRDPGRIAQGRVPWRIPGPCRPQTDRSIVPSARPPLPGPRPAASGPAACSTAPAPTRPQKHSARRSVCLRLPWLSRAKPSATRSAIPKAAGPVIDRAQATLDQSGRR